MRRSRPPHPKEGKTGDDQYPRGNPEEENRIHNLEKPRKIERFSSCWRVEGTGDQQRVPGHLNSITAPLVDEQRTTRLSIRKRPNATAGLRTSHGSDKEAQKQDPVCKAAPMCLNPHRKPQGTALPPPSMQKQPQQT